MGNADANEQYFAEERARLVRCIIEAIGTMRGEALCRVDVIAVIDRVADKFEKETYGNEESER